MLFRTLALTLITAASSWAIPVVDQQQTSTSFVFNGQYIWQQGITAGISGQLTGIDLHFVSSGVANFGINLGAPWQTDTDSAVISSLVNAAGWNYFDLTSSGIYLVAGQQFTIRFLGLTTNFSGGFPNPYAGGALFTEGQPFINDTDAAFRTYIETTVPVADAGSSWVLIAISILVIGVLRLGRTRLSLVK
jgi:hypothetical protein